MRAHSREESINHQTDGAILPKFFPSGSTNALSYSDSSFYFITSTFILLLMVFISVRSVLFYLSLQLLLSIIFLTLLFRYLPAFWNPTLTKASFSPPKNQGSLEEWERFVIFFKSLSSVLLFVFPYFYFLNLYKYYM